MDEQTQLALAFLTQAFEIDGHASLVPAEEKEAIMEAHHYKLFKLTDSKRGTFYIATLQPRV